MYCLCIGLRSLMPSFTTLGGKTIITGFTKPFLPPNRYTFSFGTLIRIVILWVKIVTDSKPAISIAPIG